MNFSDAFRETLFRFALKGNDIAEDAGLTPKQISQFRNGHNLRVDSIEKILNALSPEARLYMLSLVAEVDFEKMREIAALPPNAAESSPEGAELSSRTDDPSPMSE